MATGRFKDKGKAFLSFRSRGSPFRESGHDGPANRPVPLLRRHRQGRNRGGRPWPVQGGPAAGGAGLYGTCIADLRQRDGYHQRVVADLRMPASPSTGGWRGSWHVHGSWGRDGTVDGTADNSGDGSAKPTMTRADHWPRPGSRPPRAAATQTRSGQPNEATGGRPGGATPSRPGAVRAGLKIARTVRKMVGKARRRTILDVRLEGAPGAAP